MSSSNEGHPVLDAQAATEGAGKDETLENAPGSPTVDDTIRAEATITALGGDDYPGSAVHSDVTPSGDIVVRTTAGAGSGAAEKLADGGATEQSAPDAVAAAAGGLIDAVQDSHAGAAALEAASQIALAQAEDALPSDGDVLAKADLNITAQSDAATASAQSSAVDDGADQGAASTQGAKVDVHAEVAIAAAEDSEQVVAVNVDATGEALPGSDASSAGSGLRESAGASTAGQDDVEAAGHRSTSGHATGGDHEQAQALAEPEDAAHDAAAAATASSAADISDVAHTTPASAALHSADAAADSSSDRSHTQATERIGGADGETHTALGSCPEATAATGAAVASSVSPYDTRTASAVGALPSDERTAEPSSMRHHSGDTSGALLQRGATGTIVVTPAASAGGAASARAGFQESFGLHTRVAALRRVIARRWQVPERCVVLTVGGEVLGVSEDEAALTELGLAEGQVQEVGAHVDEDALRAATDNSRRLSGLQMPHELRVQVRLTDPSAPSFLMLGLVRACLQWDGDVR